MLKPVEACYWLIGSNNPSQPMGVAIDLHAANGDLIRENPAFDESRCFDNIKSLSHARRVAVRHARKFGIPANRVWHDSDSTGCFANC